MSDNEKNVKDINSFENGQYEFHYFANDIVGVKLSEKKLASKKYTRDQIRTMYKNPFANAEKLQDASVYFYQTSGHYKRMVDYLANMCTLDHLLYPSKYSKIKGDILKHFEKSATELNKMNVKYNMRRAIKEMLIKGIVYYFKIKDSESYVYKEMPTSICQGYAVDNGVLRYKIDVSKITKEMYKEMPLLVRQAWDKYYDKSNNGKKNKWLELGEEGVAFNILGAYSVAFPIMMYLFDSILAYDETMDLYEDQVKLDSLKLIHQRVPLDKDSMPVLKHTVIKKYHASTKKALPKTVSIATNPMELQAINFDKSAMRLKDGVVLSEDHLYGTGGISKLLFNNVTNSGEGLKKSIVVDETVVYPLLELFRVYINSELKAINKGNPFMIKFLETTYYNREDKHKLLREDLAYGGSRQMYMASMGVEPLEMLGILQLERAMEIDELFVPMQTAHTMNGDSENEAGGQEKDDVTDEGDRTRERQ